MFSFSSFENKLALWISHSELSHISLGEKFPTFRSAFVSGSSSPCRYFELSYAATCKILVCPKKIYQSVQFRTLGSALLPFSNGNRQGKPLTNRNQSCLFVRFHAGICLLVLRHFFTEIRSLTLHVNKDCGDKILNRIAVLCVLENFRNFDGTLWKN
jgi:hypothetical protein